MTYRSHLRIQSVLARPSEAEKQQFPAQTSRVSRLRKALKALQAPFNTFRRGTKHQTSVSPPVLEKTVTPQYYLHVAPSNTLTFQTSSSFTVLSGRKLENIYGAKISRKPSNNSTAATCLTTTSGVCGPSKNWDDERDDDLAVLSRIQSAFAQHDDEDTVYESSFQVTQSALNSSTTHESNHVIRPTLEVALAHDDAAVGDNHSTTTPTYSFTPTDKFKPKYTASHTTRDVFKALNAKLDALSALLPPDAVPSDDQLFSFPESRSFHARGIVSTL